MDGERSGHEASDAKRPLAVALGATACVTALSYVLPDSYQATGVGFAFLAITYALALRGDDSEKIRSHGLSFGGLLELAPIEPRRLLRDALAALAWALAAALAIFPAFWIGFVLWWDVETPFAARALRLDPNHVLGELLVIALPEEAFYRGYLQSSLDRAWKPRWKLLGAYVGPALLVTSALFAVGHFLTRMHPYRFAVFFPALLFGWLRARSGGVGAPILFHAMCNLFSAYLAAGYGLA